MTTLTAEEKAIMEAMEKFGTTYDNIQANTKYARPTIRRVMSQLIKKGLVKNGSKVGFFRIIVQENEQ